MRMPAVAKVREQHKKAPRKAGSLVSDEVLSSLTPLQRSLLKRDVQFLARVLAPIPDERLEKAAAESDSYASITTQLSQPEAHACLSADSDPWEEFMAEGLRES